MWVRSLAKSDAGCGGKAFGLARLLAAGLPVPDGFVIETRAFQFAAELADGELDTIGRAIAAAAERIEHAELPAALVAEVAARAHELGGLLAVRSSATIEDGDAGTAAGVFSSRTAVRADDVWPAIRAVWASALTPIAASYARRRHASIAIGVIVQRFVAGERWIVYTRPPGAPNSDEIWFQHAGQVHHASRTDPRFERAIAAERAIGAAAGADVELVVEPSDDLRLRRRPLLEGSQPLNEAWIVQARPIVHPTPRVRVAPPAGVLAALDDGRRWTWDIAHNPDPLSLAQSGLVARIEAAGFAPWSLRVCAGYLYSTPRRETTAVPPKSREALEQRAGEIEARLAATLDVPSGSLGDAIDRYVAFYRIWANELVPLVAASRGSPRSGGADRPSAVETTLLAAARGELDEAVVLDRLGVLSPAWDVAVPTFAERPGLIHDAIERARHLDEQRESRGWGPRRRESNPRDARRIAPSDAEDEIATAAADLAERDDLWFARAQWLVRRAILARAAELEIAADTACWLPLDELVVAADVEPLGAHRRASAARTAATRASAWMMPAVVGGTPSDDVRVALRGIGSGARITGRVVRFASLGSAVVVGSGDIVVTRAITPALAVIVIGCAAIVSETGGPLDHGTALARELGIPCVVGCHDAWSLLHDGMLVTVDGTAGTVTH